MNQTKYCKECKQVKSLGDFYRHKSCKDGRNTYCKPCDNLRSRVRYKANKVLECEKYKKRYKDDIEFSDKKRAVSKMRRGKYPEKVKKEHDNWVKLNKDKISITAKRWRDKNKHKIVTHLAIFKATRSDLVIKPKNCSVCKDATNLHGHHKDYSKPLDVVWVCCKCHANIHKEAINVR